MLKARSGHSPIHTIALVGALASTLLLSAACQPGSGGEPQESEPTSTIETTTTEQTTTPEPPAAVKPAITLPPDGTEHSMGEWLMVEVSWPGGAKAKQGKLVVNGKAVADWDFESGESYRDGYELKAAGTYELQGVVTDEDGNEFKTPVVTIAAVDPPDSDLPIGAYLGNQTSFAVVGMRDSKGEAEELAEEARRKLRSDDLFGSDAFDVDNSTHYEHMDGRKVPAGRWMVFQAYDNGEVAQGAVQRLQDEGFSAVYTSAVKMCDDPIHMHSWEEGQ